MYLRQSNKWKEYVLQEGVEDIGLPPEVAHRLRQQNEEYGPVGNKHLTWIGNLVKAVRNQHFVSANTIQTIQDDIVSYAAFPDDHEGRDAAAKAYRFFDDWHYNHTGTRGSPTLMDMKALKKSARRMLKKLDAKPFMIKQLDAYLDNRMMRALQSLTARYVPIMQLLAADPASYDELREEVVAARGEPWQALRIASDIARDILTSPVKAEEQVIHTFDNGYFWYDIRSHACDFEAKKMGHCGRGERGQLYSLRSGEKRREIKPMVTLEMDDARTVYQIKGKANEAPKPDLWPYIDWFIENAGVERIAEFGLHSSDGLGFAEMIAYLQEKHPDVKFKESWTAEADELLNQFEATIDTDSQTFLELDYASEGQDGEVGVVLRHQAFWPVKDVIVDEDTHRLRWEIKQDAQEYANDTLYPNPRVASAEVFARGVQDSQAAMLRIELIWSDGFEPEDLDNEEDVKHEIERLLEFLDEMQHASKWLVSPNAAPEEAEFDYNEFHEQVQQRLEEYGVYRDVAGEIDAEEERDKSGQMDLPLQERRIIQRWSKIIK